jgi:hypothetical protein
MNHYQSSHGVFSSKLQDTRLLTIFQIEGNTLSQAGWRSKVEHQPHDCSIASSDFPLVSGRRKTR